MSDLLNSASLVMIPSGYKEDVVYSQIPTDGSGDLSFTRASNGTRINSSGLVEVCPWNLVQYSEDFSTGWSINSSATITSNSTTAPNGTTTADTLNSSNLFYSGVYQSIGTLASNVYTYSIYAKAGTNTYLVMLAQGNGGQRAFFNLNTGTVGTTLDIDSASIENVGNGWYRCQIQKTCNGIEMFVFSSNIENTTPTASGNIYIWGAQVNIGSTAKPYFPTTDRLNVPRLTYQNGGGGCPSLLLEKQSTNIIPYSETFENWTTGFSALSPNAVTANYGISPDGTQNADRIQLTINASNTVSQIYQFPSSSMTTYTASVWLKSLSGTPTIAIVDSYNITGGYQLVTLTTEWVRHTVTFAAGSGGIIPQFLLLYGTTSNSADFLAWGFQLEASSYATSYIPTTSSSATRVADACYKTGISSLIGQTQGSVFFDFTVDTISSQTNNPVLWYMKDGGAGERYVELMANGNLEYVETNGSIIAYISKSGLTVGRHKCAIAYAPNDMVFYVDGVQIGTDTSGNPSGFSTFSFQYYISVYDGQQKVNQCVIFPTRLTNAELASLTTL